MVMLDLSLITPDFTSGTVTSATMLCVILFFPLLYACTNSFISAVISGLWFDNLCKYLQLLLHDGYGVTGVTVASKDGLKYSSGQGREKRPLSIYVDQQRPLSKALNLSQRISMEQLRVCSHRAALSSVHQSRNQRIDSVHNHFERQKYKHSGIYETEIGFFTIKKKIKFVDHQTTINPLNLNFHYGSSRGTLNILGSMQREKETFVKYIPDFI